MFNNITANIVDRLNNTVFLTHQHNFVRRDVLNLYIGNKEQVLSYDLYGVI